MSDIVKRARALLDGSRRDERYHDILTEMIAALTDALRQRDDLRILFSNAGAEISRLKSERDNAVAQVAVLAKVATAFDADLGTDCDGDTRDDLRQALSSIVPQATTMLKVLAQARELPRDEAHKELWELLDAM